MTKIAVYGEVLDQKHYKSIEGFFGQMRSFEMEFVIYDKYKKIVESIVEFKSEVKTFKNKEELQNLNVDFLVSIGGDGTMLNSFRLVFKSDIPVFGINTGRLGFLSNISTDKVKWALNEIMSGRTKTTGRSVLEITYDGQEEEIFAVNEVAIHKQDTSSMLTVHAKLNNSDLNSYWADGILVSTPTGSTAYSLSCGGPIVIPGSENFLITPIAPHNLAVRPLIYSDAGVIEFAVESRSQKFLLAFDSSSMTLPVGNKILVKKAPFSVSLLQFEDYNYLDLLRNKLMWGADKRNW